jgi:hypothetical protein
MLSVKQKRIIRGSCNPNNFCYIFLLTNFQFSGLKMEIDDVVLNLLADKAPVKARDFMLAYSEHRTTSWADAARDAIVRAGSDGHLPQTRGQLRYHAGELAIAQACHSSGAGVIPLRTRPPGGIFNVARLGRFSLVGVTVTYPGLMPRKSVTRKLLSQPNEALDPCLRLDFGEPKSPRIVTELSYFGCIVTVPSVSDKAIPAIIALGIPNAAVTEWISWIPFHRLHTVLQERADRFYAGDAPQPASVPDNAFPTFRAPKIGDADDKEEGGK